MADDLKISEMTELLSGGIHDDLLFEVADLTELDVADQNKKVKLVTLEQAFGAEDRIFKDTTIVRAWGDTDPAAVTMDMFETENAAVVRFFDAQGSLSRLDIGGMGTPGIFMRYGLGSDPYIQAMSGTDVWFYVHPDEQRLGSNAAGNSNIQVTQGSDIIRAYISSSIWFELNNTSEEILLGPADGQIKLDIGDDYTWTIVADGNNVARFAFDSQRIGISTDTNIQTDSSTDQITMEVANTTEVTIGTGGMSLKAGATVNEIETTLTDDDTHLPSSGAVVDAIAAAGGGQNGQAAIANAATTVTVTFGTAESDTNYYPVISIENLTDSPPSIYAMIVSAKTVNGFTVTFSGPMDSANYKLNWRIHR